MRYDLELLDFLRCGGTVLASNARAARALERDFSDHQQALGHLAWVAPEIKTWQVWLDELWQRHLFSGNDSRLLLDAAQERSVWTRIVARDPAVKQVMSPDTLAALAQEAYALLGEYRTDSTRSWKSGGSDDAAAFCLWADAFDRECRENNWLSRSCLASELEPLLINGTVTVPDKIRMLGFDRLTPAQQHFLDSSGRGIKASRPPVTSDICSLFAAPDTRTEILECAHWLRSTLLKDPAKRLAVIVPNLHNLRDELDRVLRRVLMPRSMYLAPWETQQYGTVTDTEGESPLAFEFSLGVPLGSVPVIRAALLLLRWLIDPLSQEEVSWLMLSGFVADAADEPLQLAQLDAYIRTRSLLPPEVELGAFLKQKRHAKPGAEGIFQRLNAFAGAALKSGVVQQPRSAMDWAEELPGLLSLAGWPGSKTQSSLRFQAIAKWEQLLIQLASLSFDGRSVTFRESLKVTEQLAVETLFAPQSRDAPVQIIGAFESSGQVFDAIWFMAADENSWPTQAHASPLIPLAIQRALRMPHSSIAVDWELARVATQRIASSGSECIFSYAKQTPSGEQRVSPLILEVVHERRIEDSFAAESNVTDTVAIEEVDESAPIPWPRELVAGGSGVLTSQSACAFRAFAERRLFAVDPDSSDWGLNALDRGLLMHSVLQGVWGGERGLGSLDGLETAIAEEELDSLLDRSIEDAFAKHPATRAPEGWHRAYIEVEKVRTKALVRQWLDYELRRQPFEIEACEKEIADLCVGELRLKVRLDRIDTLPNGHKVLIDYKTGNVSASKWAGPRPEEPQLPLYAAFGNLGDVDALLFAQIRAGSTQFKGQAKDPREISPLLRKGKTVVTLSERDIEGWRAELLRLADDFLHGQADVAPRNYPKTCTYCGMQGLCRVATTDVPLNSSDAGADENGQAESE
jgi:probable DNA repair protein